MENQLTPAELEATCAEELPARHEMALLNLNLMVPVNVGAALNLLTADSNAVAFAEQFTGVVQQ
jgi:hypothetical protein